MKSDVGYFRAENACSNASEVTAPSSWRERARASRGNPGSNEHAFVEGFNQWAIPLLEAAA